MENVEKINEKIKHTHTHKLSTFVAWINVSSSREIVNKITNQSMEVLSNYIVTSGMIKL